MITTYETFKDRIVAMIKIRSANYVETDCDVTELIYSVYEDIQEEILLETYKQEYITQGLEEFTLPDYDSTVVSEITKKYTDVLDIVDENDISIMEYLHLTDDNTWRWNKYYPCTAEYPDDMSIYFIRKQISNIESLPGIIYSRLLTAMLEGIMYYIQTAIPNQVDGQVGNYSYQRYYNAKKELANKQPQYRYRFKEETQWL